MLKRLKTLFTSGPTAANCEETRYPVSEHGIKQRDISSSALRVISELQDAGFEAYLVGGGVRDLLLSGKPKDFDVATDATPEQVQSVFRRARIIGRRFKIVHVRFGREIIEVTTFRGAHTDASPSSKKAASQAVQSDKGILLRDNVYGDLISDALRRDFTVNALYYDPSTQEIIDYTGGIHHLDAQELHLIGNADARYKEDPVRMLRAIRFKSKLGFNLDRSTEKPIKEHSEYLLEIPPARLFEEVLKLFLSGKAKEILNQLHNYHLLTHLFPGAARILESEHASSKQLLQIAARNTDARIAQNKRVTPAFIFAAFLWPSLQLEILRLREQAKGSEQELMFKAADNVIREQQQRTSIPKRFLIPMREIWTLQLRFPRRDPKRAFALLEHNRFRAAYDFLLLREECGELSSSELGDWWTVFQDVDRDEQMNMLSAVKPSRPRRKRTRSRKPTTGNNE